MTRPEPTPLKPIAVIAGMAGNMMEWYDFALYGVMAPTLGNLFFPQSNHLISIISVFGVFAAGYIMRLDGGAFFGYITDHYGRRIALLTPATLMAGVDERWSPALFQPTKPPVGAIYRAPIAQRSDHER